MNSKGNLFLCIGTNYNYSNGNDCFKPTDQMLGQCLIF